MIALPVKTIKILLIILCGLITLHFVFISQKRYSIGGTRITINDLRLTFPSYGLSGRDYYIIANTNEDYKRIVPLCTTIKYFNVLPEWTIYFFHLSYFLIICFIIYFTTLKDT
jgi:hypothetical protein